MDTAGQASDQAAKPDRKTDYPAWVAWQKQHWRAVRQQRKRRKQDQEARRKVQDEQPLQVRPLRPAAARSARGSARARTRPAWHKVGRVGRHLAPARTFTALPRHLPPVDV